MASAQLLPRPGGGGAKRRRRGRFKQLIYLIILMASASVGLNDKTLWIGGFAADAAWMGGFAADAVV